MPFIRSTTMCVLCRSRSSSSGGADQGETAEVSTWQFSEIVCLDHHQFPPILPKSIYVLGMKTLDAPQGNEEGEKLMMMRSVVAIHSSAKWFEVLLPASIQL